MSSVDNKSPFDTSPTKACDAIASFSGLVLVDLDETLYLRNSTEEFLNCAMPGLLALILLRTLDFLKPWRLTGGEVTRDVWRVRLILLFFPWTMPIWRSYIKTNGLKHRNSLLAQALHQRTSSPTILTVGFLPIVKPLITAMGFESSPVIAARLSTFADRQSGKLAMAIVALGEDAVRSSLLVTDSKDDLPILQVCAQPLRVIWPDAKYHQALSNVYLPGQYIAHVKRPGQRYIFRGIVQEDFSFWVLSTLALAANPFTHVAGLILLLLSFWTVYEMGYVDNDRSAEKYEHAPKLSDEFWSSSVATPTWQPWIWASLSSICAILLLDLPDPFDPIDLIKWVTLLLGTYCWFWLYNRYDKSTRVWMFAVLQFLRGAAFMFVVPCMEIGVAAVGAHVLSRWMPYFFYRYGAKNWPDNPSQLVRLLFFIVLALLLIIAIGTSVVTNWTTVGILGWCIFRARHELHDTYMKATRIDSEHLGSKK